MRNACMMGKMQETARGVYGNLIPQFRDLRRIPMRYQHSLPLAVMKQHRCAVVGSAQGVLTVAITDQQDTSLIEALTRFTGQTIFPVCVKPSRLRLLIQRVERWEERKDKMLRWPHSLSLVQRHMIVTALAYRVRKEN